MAIVQTPSGKITVPDLPVAELPEAEPDEMEVLRRQVQALEQQSAMLVECLLEISEILYE